MSVSDFKDLFGGGAGVVALALLAIVSGLVIWAVIKGREVSLGPLKIGARVDPVGKDSDSPDDTSTAPATRGRFDEEFETDRAREFYQRIAADYDRRNSAKLVETQQEVVNRIGALRERRPDLRLLDLGGGTGGIARAFADDGSISWTYVDFSPAMAEQFRLNLTGTRLFDRATVHVADLTALPRVAGLRQGSYDVVLLSIVLSSLPRLPDFGGIARMLAPGGVLIIADINPPYTQSKPYYAVSVNGTEFALRTNPVHPLDVAQRAARAGLWKIGEPKLIGTRAVDYAYIAAFAPTVARRKTRREQRPFRTARALLRR